MSKTLDALQALFQATPTGSTAEGFWVNAPRRLGYQDPVAVPTTLPPAKLPLPYEIGMFPFYHEDLQQNGRWLLSRTGETESVYFYFNQLPVQLAKDLVAEEPRGAGEPPTQFYLRPRITGRYQGLPLYEEEVLVVARANRDPWAPVALSRVMKATLPLYEKDRQTAEARLAGLKKKNDEIQSPAWEKDWRDQFEKNNAHVRTSNRPENFATRFKAMEREIVYLRQQAAAEANPKRDASGSWYWNPIDAHAAFTRRQASLTPAEAAGPACFVALKTSAEGNGRYTMRGDVLPAGASPDCREVVLTNYNYFDLSLPRTTPQLLTVRDFGRCAKLDAAGQIVSLPVTRFDAPPQGCYRHALMWRELDWKRFAALVVP
ncbi:MAG: hypothetical protein K2X03_04455 [Bryobacteraceae bacterium]|nr:hypothetical protein [Bryobacteraceae bacterium]